MRESGDGEAWVALRAPMRTAQTVSLALVGGVIMFTAVAFILRGSVGGGPPPGGGQPPQAVPGVPTDVLAYIAVAMLFGSFVIGTVIREQFLRRRLEARMREDGGLTTRNAPVVGAAIVSGTILSSSIVEAAGLLAGVSILMGGPPWAVAVSTGTVGVLLLWFPTTGKIRTMMQEATGMAAT